MKKITIILFITLLLSGCASYQFKKGLAPYDKGYLVSYDGKNIPEYTIGKENSVPDLALAKERFNRRRARVEDYYKKMGDIESRWKEYFIDPPSLFIDLIGGIFRWPFIAVDDYKYNRDPKYKEKIDKLDEEKDVLEKARIDGLKEKLKVYIADDLNKENDKAAPVVQNTIVSEQPVVSEKIIPAVVVVADQAKPVETEKPISVIQQPISEQVPVVEQQPVAEQRAIVEQKKEKIELVSQLQIPNAVITANPVAGTSPLRVKFSGSKSSSKNGKIVSYDWDFGDGDTSTLKNPENTYWSATYGSREFTVTLTVKDAKGMTAASTATITVINN